MDRAKFEATLKAGAVKLVAYTPPGFAEPIYLKPLTMADIKAQLLKPDEPKEVRERILKDEFYIERSLARIIRDETGALIYDEKDDAQMSGLRAVLNDSPHNLSNLIIGAQDGLMQPTKDEVGPTGN